MSFLKKKSVIIVCILTTLLMLTASIWDLQISNTIYAPDSLFAKFFERYGESISMFAGFGGAAFLFASASATPAGKKRKLRYGLAGFGLYLAAIGLLVVSVSGLIKTHDLLGFAQNMAVLALAFCLFFFCLKRADRSDPELLLRIGIVMVLVSLGQTLLVNIIKVPWGRPRYRSIIITEGLEFQPWWITGRSLRDAYEGILAHEEFKSFPSGHVASATCSFALPLLSLAVPRIKEKPLLLLAIVWTVCTMIARIMIGAHFLSDVTVGFFITFLLLLLLYHCLIKSHRKEGVVS